MEKQKERGEEKKTEKRERKKSFSQLQPPDLCWQQERAGLRAAQSSLLLSASALIGTISASGRTTRRGEDRGEQEERHPLENYFLPPSYYAVTCL